MPVHPVAQPEDLVRLVARDDLDELDELLTDLAAGRLTLVRPRPVVWHTIAWMIDAAAPQHALPTDTDTSLDTSPAATSTRPDRQSRRCWRPLVPLRRRGTRGRRPDGHSTRSTTA